ncbi:putative multi-sensor signal transduction histidine kinase [Actinoplanes missouriensis 431]|uniref:Sensor-like histidine kinase SenX3 n=1 Tax=Actinoplanes missouriensis (strain ATCC 14538 / DSM 43046 / CBS 188.64 / JCM 3121 / NBRC 102363 / NCIMB 12654 / NRRL B-3342 / UNCC 431) TaxID=512565 RepID=I0HAB4_ACTM4|nr:ATP-binding protein [Actinoplanes missouriensis]BAL89951.1 putative multi-sensor signal transduction histidine kinase [Actinoplanes missouriensis 431]
MSYRISLARTMLFALVYGVAVYTGRRAALDHSGDSLVWPSAGVGALWFCAQRHARTPWVDRVLLPLILVWVTLQTGAAPWEAVLYGMAGLTQATLFRRLLARLRPNLWGGAGAEPLRAPRDLWGLLAAAFGAAASACAVGSVGEWVHQGDYPLPATVMNLARNVTSILIIGSVGICVAGALATVRSRFGGRAGWWPRARSRLAGASPWRIAEHLAIVVGTTAAYLAGFAYEDRLPLSFAMLGWTVLVATRLSTPFVLVHNSVAAGIAVTFTRGGSGPFAHVPDPTVRAVMVQLFLALVALVGLALALGRDERRQLLTQLGHEKELLRAIIDSMADGLAVIEPDGRVSLRNPAVSHLLGGVTSPDDRMADPAWYGLHHVDGTPFPEDGLAYIRALAGEDVQGVEMLVRNAGVPEGRFITVTATSLPRPGGTRSAVVLFHDVTAEHRQRDELTSFAGVVAHDLLNPLTGVQGWTEAVHDSVAGAPPHPNLEQALTDLDRLSRTSARMRGLIDGLLAYTTARQATAEPISVDTAAVLADVTGARADAAVAAGQPEPKFTIGPAPPVCADPVLLRQLLDNLIGNAIKYTAPGVTPTLVIDASRTGDMVSIRIADNGVGIPAGQHTAIFGDFHRAHTDGRFLGTGLGLAICRRIVERHGGTITAEDNAGGGSCFTVTLPAAVPAPAPDQLMTSA